jgi:hypothetical protein
MRHVVDALRSMLLFPQRRRRSFVTRRGCATQLRWQAMSETAGCKGHDVVLQWNALPGQAYSTAIYQWLRTCLQSHSSPVTLHTHRSNAVHAHWPAHTPSKLMQPVRKGCSLQLPRAQQRGARLRRAQRGLCGQAGGPASPRGSHQRMSTEKAHREVYKPCMHKGVWLKQQLIWQS